MQENDFFEKHGHRFCFYLIYNIVGFIPFAWTKYTTNEAQHQWDILYEMLLGTGCFLPFFIEGCFMRKKATTYRDRTRTIRSFFLAPVFGLLATLLLPVVYFMYLVFGLQPGLFTTENTAWILTVFFGFVIEMTVLVLMAVEAHRIRKKLEDEIYAHIIRGLQSIGSQGQRYSQAIYDRHDADNTFLIDLSENAEPYIAKDFTDSMKECLVCCEPFKKKCPVVRLPCNPDKHFFHQKCIESWFANNKQGCPLCRQTVAKVELEVQPDARTEEEKDDDQAFERLLDGPFGGPRRQSSINRRSVSLLVDESREDASDGQESPLLAPTSIN